MSTADNYKSYFFNIAELNVKITFKESRYNSMRLLPSFAPFKTAEEGKDLFFHLTIDPATDTPSWTNCRTEATNI